MIVFVRHGQTAVNRSGQLQGRVDAPLTDAGVAQARRVAAALADADVAAVLTSPLGRAATTAAEIAAPHGARVEVDDRLVELDYGAWDQRAFTDVTTEEWAAWRADPTFAPPGGESLLAVERRVAELCAERLGDALVVCVSHVSPIKAAVCWALGIGAAATWRMHLDLASITRVGRRGPNPYLASFNETSHLAR